MAWQRRHGRRDLPWQGTRDAYRLWVSEIMLQQTQVSTVIPYFERFMARFPDVASLAMAAEDEVLRHWSGLGYYARARNLHRAALLVLERHEGAFPLAPGQLEALPGVGRSTAAAIAAFATGKPHAILDGNVKRVLARHRGIEGPVDSAATLARLWDCAGSLLPGKGIEAYTQGLMDLGATVCTRTRPACDRCPVRTDCIALRESRIGELPGAKAARAVARRETAMLVVLSRGDVLVEKRPSRGIWGGLWSLPEASASLGAAEVADVARESFGVSSRAPKALASFEHAFTHFTLRIQPWLVTARGRPGEPGGAGTMWLPLAEAGAAALPAPVKKLLAALAR